VYRRAGLHIGLLAVLRYIRLDYGLVCLLLFQSLLRPLECLESFDGVDLL
jgi:hypothetical protein